jgi:2-iminobutanoate/2-iminopropanoate deaminase
MEKVVVEGLARLPAFSHAAVAGDTIYVSGTLGTLPDTVSLAPGGAGPETTQTLKNLEAILRECGASMSDVVKVNVYLSDLNTINEMNDAYLEVFQESPPARITLGGVDLALGAAVEMECIAHKPI